MENIYFSADLIFFEHNENLFIIELDWDKDFIPIIN